MYPATGDFDASVRKISTRVMQSPGRDTRICIRSTDVSESSGDISCCAPTTLSLRGRKTRGEIATGIIRGDLKERLKFLKRSNSLDSRRLK